MSSLVGYKGCYRKGEFSKDGLSWEKDLELTYKRVE